MRLARARTRLPRWCIEGLVTVWRRGVVKGGPGRSERGRGRSFDVMTWSNLAPGAGRSGEDWVRSIILTVSGTERSVHGLGGRVHLGALSFWRAAFMCPPRQRF